MPNRENLKRDTVAGEYYQVSALRKARWNNGQWTYLVKWEEWGEQDNRILQKTCQALERLTENDDGIQKALPSISYQLLALDPECSGLAQSSYGCNELYRVTLNCSRSQYRFEEERILEIEKTNHQRFQLVNKTWTRMLSTILILLLYCRFCLLDWIKGQDQTQMIEEFQSYDIDESLMDFGEFEEANEDVDEGMREDEEEMEVEEDQDQGVGPDLEHGMDENAELKADLTCRVISIPVATTWVW
ncbi:hypothetical protein K435DRAFT_810478 [Dendrothele bispora CBS 962.96]|uniref:Chromo domain-containing protein n=1 Tax=Dendrothele bispora (strain CBS 962.96) TaxID=1314807 RepID=A0A4S8KW19_DENBC|nr:hypothetical protein K435DRAFT_810478 [Dendrothele bispora CBS 962.96]